MKQWRRTEQRAFESHVCSTSLKGLASHAHCAKENTSNEHLYWLVCKWNSLQLSWPVFNFWRQNASFKHRCDTNIVGLNEGAKIELAERVVVVKLFAFVEKTQKFSKTVLMRNLKEKDYCLLGEIILAFWFWLEICGKLLCRTIVLPGWDFAEVVTRQIVFVFSS